MSGYILNVTMVHRNAMTSGSRVAATQRAVAGVMAHVSQTARLARASQSLSEVAARHSHLDATPMIVTRPNASTTAAITVQIQQDQSTIA